MRFSLFRRLATPARALAGLALALATLPAPHAQTPSTPDRDKLAQTGMKFLSVPGDPRGAAMGSAATAMTGGAEMLFSNPAGMAWTDRSFGLMLGQTQFLTDIDYTHASLAYRPGGGRFGVIGVSLATVDYGSFQETIRSDNEQGYLDLGEFSPQAYAVGLGYARALSDRFSAGGQIKYANQNLGASVSQAGDEDGAYVRQENEQGVLAYDFGVQYKTGFESLVFAVAARNFSQEIAFEEESFQLPLTLQIGVSMDVMDLTALGASGDHSFVLAVDAENPRDYAEQIKLGGEYTFLDTFSLRGGYVFPSDEQGIHLGAGVRQSVGGLGLAADYGFSDYGVFSGVHRVAVRLSL